MSRCVLVLGGEIKNYELVRSFLREEDYFLFCDKGLVHSSRLGVRVDLAVGDFDSCVPHSIKEIVRFPSNKDDTDALCGLKEGIKRGYKEFLILGALGGRVDHEIGNIYLLEYLDRLGLYGRIENGSSYIEMVSSGKKTVKKGVKYFSLLAVFGKAEDIWIRGAKYNLEGKQIEPGFQYGISNECEEDEAEILVKKGKLLLVVIRDE